MVADRTEANMELTTDQSSQDNGHLLQGFLNQDDFRSTFRKDMPNPGFLPPADQMLALTDDPQDRVEAGGGGGSAAKVEWNNDGRVSKIEYPNSPGFEFEYDKSGGLKRVKDLDPSKDGRYWEKDRNGNWNRHNKDGSRTGDSLGKANWQVDQAGNVTFDNEDRTMGTVTSPDGKSATIERDKNGHVTKVDYPGPDKREFEYDKNGDLTKVKYPNKYYYEKAKDGTWELHRPNGTKTGDKLSQITVDKDGTILAKSADKLTMTKRDPLGNQNRWKLIDL